MAEVFDALTPDQLRARNTIKWNHFAPDVLPLWIAEMDFPTAPAVLDGLRAWVSREEFGYPALDSDALPVALARWCEHRYGWPVQPEWVRVVPDVLKGMEVVIEFLTRPESPVVLPVPAYMPFFDVLTVTGRQRVEIPMTQQNSGRYLMDLDYDEVAKALGTSPQNARVRVCRAKERLRNLLDRAEKEVGL